MVFLEREALLSRIPGDSTVGFGEARSKFCDAPNPGGTLTTRQPAKNLCVSYHETHT